MKINKDCGVFLGCHVAERILSHVFKDVDRMPYGNKGFDFICNKGYKIDSKSSCLRHDIYWFQIKHNKIADYFLCIGFDNREDLNPQHIWLIKSDEIMINYTRFKKLNHERSKKLNELNTLTIANSKLLKYSKYELTDKLKETIECCSTLKNNRGEDL